MKKILYLFLLVLLFGVLGGCQKEDIGNNYVNEDYEFTFEIPSNWKEKYKVIEADEKITFIYSEYKDKDGIFQELFTIHIMSKEEYEKSLNDPPITSELLDEREGQSYVVSIPLDNIIVDEDKIEEYIQMLLSEDEIKKRFLLNE